MTATKRLFDICGAVFLGVLLSPLIVGVALLVAVRDGRPVLFRSERMRGPDEGFMLWKFRSMRPAASDGGVSGGDKANRVTPTGRFLRRRRLDELPQLWNILRGDISFVGPRPPLRRYVEMFPDLYAEVLKSRPGVTGLATLAFHRTEERLLEGCTTAAETEAIYVARCVPRKATLDLIYQRHGSVCYDLRIMFATVWRRLPLRRRRRA